MLHSADARDCRVCAGGSLRCGGSHGLLLTAAAVSSPLRQPAWRRQARELTEAEEPLEGDAQREADRLTLALVRDRQTTPVPMRVVLVLEPRCSGGQADLNEAALNTQDLFQFPRLALNSVGI